jgi:stearoyl-CoA desaturase (delta-9 desaturase)
MKIYNAIGYGIIVGYALACMIFAPPHLGPWWGLLIGATYFVVVWFIGGLYLSAVIHMGVAHRALDYKQWFIQAVTVVNNTFGVYINPVTWVNRHRLHHRYSDHAGDPNKLSSDGFWRTMMLCVFAVAASVFNFWLLSLLVGDLAFAAVIWVLFRVFTLWINMVQNYWTHDRRFGTRRYDDERDNAMNIGEWLPVTITYSACLQNNHHHSPGLLRLSHDESEYDFGFLMVKVMKALGLVKATSTGAELPQDVPLKALNF